jgi:phage host-nuclease inhibitor protein Gam
MVEALDINILHIENIRNSIEHLVETYRDIVDDMNLANSDKKSNIPETYITQLGQMEKELTGLDTSICSGISALSTPR